MKGRVIGIIVLLLVIAVGLLVYTMTTWGNQITVKGYVGGEKIGFFNDEEVQKILRRKFGITVDDTKAGSYEMMDANLDGIDFLFPSSQVALEIFKVKQNSVTFKTERIFQSPIVIYSWIEVADALVDKGVAKHVNGEYYTVDFNALIPYLTEPDRSWQDLGLSLYGNVKVMCTDPNKSNSGNMYTGLLYQVLTDNGLSRAEAIKTVDDTIKNLGFMEHSSGTLFESYLIKGMGANPMIIGYENQIVEFALENPDIWQNAKGNVAILVPEPTVWSEHPVIALTDNGQKLIEALSDPEIRQLAWQKHGFRYPAFSNSDDTVVALPQTLDIIVDMPSVDVMLAIMQQLDN